MKERYTVAIAGYQLNLLSDDGEDYIRSLADIVGREMQNILLHARNTNAVEAALLVALDAVDSRVKAVEEFRSQQKQIADQLTEIAGLKAQVAQLAAELAVTELPAPGNEPSPCCRGTACTDDGDGSAPADYFDGFHASDACTDAR